MAINREFNLGVKSSPFGFLGPLLILAVFFSILFFVAKGLFWVLKWIAPVLLIATLIINYKVVTEYLQYIWRKLKEDPLIGLFFLILTVLGHPFVIGYLFFKALGIRSIKKAYERVEKEQNTFTEFEEIVEEGNFLELPTLEKEPEPQSRSESERYDELFK